MIQWKTISSNDEWKFNSETFDIKSPLLSLRCESTSLNQSPTPEGMITRHLQQVRNLELITPGHPNFAHRDLENQSLRVYLMQQSGNKPVTIEDAIIERRIIVANSIDFGSEDSMMPESKLWKSCKYGGWKKRHEVATDQRKSKIDALTPRLQGRPDIILWVWNADGTRVRSSKSKRRQRASCQSKQYQEP
jgi:hypothetical protein